MEYPGTGEESVGNAWNGGTVQLCGIGRNGNAVSVRQSNYPCFGIRDYADAMRIHVAEVWVELVGGR